MLEPYAARVSHLSLRPLRLSDEADAQAAHAELAAEGFEFLLHQQAGEAWKSYVRRLDEIRGGHVPPDRVPGTFLVAEVDGTLVGRVSIRHELNDFLANFGGHIGYGIRPAYRRRGYAGAILRQALDVARSAGVSRVLLTCDDGNDASASIIERAGGVLEDIRVAPDGIGKRRYWIG
jgi:predicted acetyltransferase